MESNTSKLSAYLRAGLESGGVGENGRKRVRLGSDLRTSVFGGVMFGAVEEISLCGRKKKWGSIFGRLFTVGERGLEGGQAEDEEQGERERKRERESESQKQSV